MRFWSCEGELVRITKQVHDGPVFSVKWNKQGRTLLSGGVDTTVCVWDGDSGELVKKLKHHTAPVLEMDWRDDQVFATCSVDKSIHVASM